MLIEVLPAPVYRQGVKLNIIVPPDCTKCTGCTGCTHCSNECTQGCDTCGTGKTKKIDQELISKSDFAVLLQMIESQTVPA